MSSQRYDQGEVSNVERLDNGFIRADARITRAGVFNYRRADGSIRRELRLPAEVFNEDSIRSFEVAPLTNNHPGERVTSINVGKFKIGTVTNVRADSPFVAARIQIEDQGSIDLAEAGKRSLSCGYVCDVEDTGGVTFGIPGVPDGLRFDAVQRNIRGNHVALVDAGRAGPDAKLRLDHDDAIQIGDTKPGDPSPKPEVTTMPLVKIRHDGIDVEVTEGGAQVIAALNARLDAKTDTATALEGDNAKEKARADKAEEDLTAEKKAREDAEDPKAIDKRVAARVGLVTKAREVLGADYKVDGLDEAAIKRDVVIKLAKDPAAAKLKLDDNDAAYLSARYDAAIETFEPKPGIKPIDNVRRMTRDAKPREDVEDARQRMVKRNAEIWERKKEA